MAVYRRGWNGLTCLNPEVDTFPETMELQVFTVPRRPRITVEPMPRKKSNKNTVLWSITLAALAGLIIAGCAQRMTAGVGVAMAVCITWTTIFLAVNRRKL